MTIDAGSDEEVDLYLDFMAHFESDEVRRAFVFLHLSFGRLDYCKPQVGRHGVMKSLRIYDGGQWCFSFAPARKWVKAWVRPPEYRKGLLDLTKLTAVLPQAEDRGDDHFVVRLHDVEDARHFFAVIASSRS